MCGDGRCRLRRLGDGLGCIRRLCRRLSGFLVLLLRAIRPFFILSGLLILGANQHII